MIVLCADNAGPAKHLAVIVKNLKSECMIFSSRVSARCFDMFGLKSRILPRHSFKNDIKRFFSSHRPCLVVTGTSWGDALEKYFLKYALEDGTRSISIIDNWSFYKEGFQLGGKLVLPDYIIVNDKSAKDAAVRDGLPKQIIYPLGNAYLDYLAHYEFNSLGLSRPLISSLPGSKKTVLFISEDYSGDFPKGGDYYQGFDEFRVLDDILSILKDDEQLIIKLHPSESKNKYRHYKRKNIIIASAADINGLMASADFIIGMGSMFLLEASLKRRDIISFRPGAKNDFIGNKLGATFLVNNRLMLRKIFDRKINLKNADISHNFARSIKKIVSFIEEKGL